MRLHGNDAALIQGMAARLELTCAWMQLDALVWHGFLVRDDARYGVHEGYAFSKHVWRAIGLRAERKVERRIDRVAEHLLRQASASTAGKMSGVFSSHAVGVAKADAVSRLYATSTPDWGVKRGLA